MKNHDLNEELKMLRRIAELVGALIETSEEDELNPQELYLSQEVLKELCDAFNDYESFQRKEIKPEYLN